MKTKVHDIYDELKQITELPQLPKNFVRKERRYDFT